MQAQFTEIAADAIGRSIAAMQREFQQAEELRNTQLRAKLAEIDAAELRRDAEIRRLVDERLASVRDGRDGADGAPGQNGADGSPGRDGKDPDPVFVENAVADAVSRAVAAIELPAGPLGPPGKDGLPGAAGAAGRDGIDGKDGKDGERGPEGAHGKLPPVQAWTDGVHYEGAVVTHEGSAYQARRDTGRAPPHKDWLCIAQAGRNGEDGRTFMIRGTWSAEGKYRALDVVALNGASFAARRDGPGACPGEGWQLIASQGKRGNPGEPGRKGDKGERGEPGQPLISADVDEDGLLTLTNGDGSTVTCDLYPLLAKLGR